jgi:hypothetical protein
MHGFPNGDGGVGAGAGVGAPRLNVHSGVGFEASLTMPYAVRAVTIADTTLSVPIARGVLSLPSFRPWDSSNVQLQRAAHSQPPAW